MSTLHVVCRVGDAEYVLPASDILQMEPWQGATRVPGAPAHVAGLVQTRGRVVPVVDLRRRFGLPEVERALGARIVVVQRGERRVGLLVDSAREVVHVPADAFEEPPELLAAQADGFVRAVARLGQRLVLLVNLDQVIGEGLHHG